MSKHRATRQQPPPPGPPNRTPGRRALRTSPGSGAPGRTPTVLTTGIGAASVVIAATAASGMSTTERQDSAVGTPAASGIGLESLLENRATQPTRSGARGPARNARAGVDGTGHDSQEHRNAQSLAADRSDALQRLDREADNRSRGLFRAARAWGAPLSSYTVTATFGQSGAMWAAGHTGLDMAATTGTPVMAVGPAEVIYAGYDGSYGNKVELRHPDGTVTWYAHMTSIDVRVGQSVTAGDVVGTVGATGNVTGPHLHLEARPGGGEPTDPRTTLARQGVIL